MPPWPPREVLFPRDLHRRVEAALVRRPGEDASRCARRLLTELRRTPDRELGGLAATLDVPEIIGGLPGGLDPAAVTWAELDRLPKDF